MSVFLFSANVQSLFLLLVLNHKLCACLQFSLIVHHSKFSTLLSAFIPFIWFTWGLLYGFLINVWATNLWIFKCFVFHSSYTFQYTYHKWFLNVFNINVIHLLFFRKFQKQLTSYLLYQGTCFQISIFIKNAWFCLPAGRQISEIKHFSASSRMQSD